MRLFFRGWVKFWQQVRVRRIRPCTRPAWRSARCEALERRELLATVSTCESHAIYESMSASFTVTRDGSTADDLLVYYSMSGSASSGSDYESLPGSVVIPSGQSSAYVLLQTNTDLEDEPTETAILTLSNDNSYEVATNCNTSSVDIWNLQPTPTVMISSYDSGISEGSSGSFTISRDYSDTEVTVYYSVGGSASHGSDVSYLQGYVTLPAYTSSASVYLSAYSDSYNEGTESLDISLSTGYSSYNVSSSNSNASIAIWDVLPTPTVTISSYDSGVSEGSSGSFTISRDYSDTEMTVYYSVSGSATNGGDISYLQGYVTMPQYTSSVQVYFSAYSDSNMEGTEYLDISLTSGSSYSSANISIWDVWSPPMPTVSISSYDGASEGSSGSFTVSRDYSDTEITVYYSVSGSAGNGSDVSYLQGYVTMPAYTTSVPVNFSVYSDSYVEGTEYVDISLSTGSSSYNVSGNSSASIPIWDVVAVPTVNISTSSNSLSEGTGGSFTVNRDYSDTEITVYYTVSGSAGNSADISYLQGYVTLPAYTTSVPVYFSALTDALFEETEYLEVSLNTGFSSYIVGMNSSASFAINDVWTLATASISSYDSGVYEGTGGSFVVSRDYADGTEITVHYSVSGTASNGGDVSYLQGYVTIPAYVSSVPVYFSAYSDWDVEGTEQLNISLSAGYSAYRVSATNPSASISIWDVQPATPTVQIVNHSTDIWESSVATFTLQRSGDTSGALNIQYSLGGSAVNGADYFGVPGTARFSSGESQIAISLVTLSDYYTESNETIEFSLLDGTDYNLSGTTTGTATIHDLTTTWDPNKPTVWGYFDDSDAAEVGSNAARFVVERNEVANSLYAFIAFDNISTTYGDFTGAEWGVSFSPGQRYAYITIQAVDDDIAEGDEILLGRVLPGTDYNGSSYSSMTIRDEAEAPQPIVSISALENSIYEGQTATFRLSLSAPFQTPTWVYVRADGAAETDGTFNAMAVLFNAGQATKDIYFSAALDGIGEGPESLRVAVVGSNLYELGATNTSASLVILEQSSPTTTGIPNVTVNEDSPAITISLGEYFSDAEDSIDELTFTFANANPQLVSIAVNHATQQLLITPLANQFGTANVTVTATDSVGANVATSFSITITPVNDAPGAQPDTYDTPEDTSITVTTSFGVLHNDADVDSISLSVEVVSSPAHGSLLLAANGSFTYTPDENYSGPDTFSYRVYDGQTYSATAMVSLTVHPVNDPPVANHDTYQAIADTMLAVTSGALGLLANDVEIDQGDNVSLSSLNGQSVVFGQEIALASGAKLVLQSNGTFTYDPRSSMTFASLGIGQSATDTFTYGVIDGAGATDTAMVTITVQGVAALDVPAPMNDAYTLREDQTLPPDVTRNLLTNDQTPVGTGSLVVTGVIVGGENFPAGAEVTLPSGATLTIFADGRFEYDPTSSDHRDMVFSERDADAVRYVVQNTAGRTSSAQLMFTIAGVDDPFVTNRRPLSTDDRYLLRRGGTLETTGAQGVLGNDRDLEGTALTVQLRKNVAHGTLALQSDGNFIYTPASDFVGVDEFTYVASDGALVSTVTVVRLQVTNSAPIGLADAYQTSHGQALVLASGSGLLKNDVTDPGETLTAQLLTGPQHGTLTLGIDGSFTYAPDDGYVGSDSFIYRASDGLLLSEPVTVALTITNDAPQATGESYFLLHDKPFTKDAAAGLLSNDAGEPGETLTVQLLQPPVHGTLELAANGSFTYVPEASYVGTDQFFYKVSDGTQASQPVVVRLNVTNRRPASTDDHYFAIANASLSVNAAQGLLANDQDDIGDQAIITITQQPANGSLTVAADGSFSYTPASGFIGIDYFYYRISDGILSGDTAEVVVDVTDAPARSRDDAYLVDHSRTFVATAAQGVLANDWKAGGGALSVQALMQPSHGTLTLNADGSFTYQPVNSYVGEDSFTYQALLDGLAVATSTVLLRVTNETPIANGDEYQVPQDGSLVTTAVNGVLRNDSDEEQDTITVTLAQNVTQGALQLNADGSFSYTPNSGFAGYDQFTYVASDGLGNSGPIAVRLRVFNNAPITNADYYSIHHTQTLVTTAATGLMSNDHDDPGQTLTISLTRNVNSGNLTLQPDGTFTYVPAAGFYGEVTFAYRLWDGRLSSRTFDGADVAQEVRISVTNAVPTAVPDVFFTTHGRPIVVPASQGLLSNDQDLDGDVLAPERLNGPANGTLVLQADGSFVYEPDDGYVGLDSFTYKVSDGASHSNTVEVLLHIENALPVASDDRYSVVHDRELVVSAASGLLQNDTDANQDAITFEIVQQPQYGSLAHAADGSFTYSPEEHFVGEDYFLYRLSDGAGYSKVARATLSVSNSRPSLFGSDYSLRPNQTLNVTAAEGLLKYATDADGDALTIQIIQQPAHGTLQPQPDGSFSFSPHANYVGQDHFVYRVSDGASTTENVHVRLTIANAVPVANHDFYRVQHGQTLIVAAADGILANDWDVDSDTLQINVTQNPQTGSLTTQPDGAFTYVPATDFAGEVRFLYYVSDASSQSEVRTVTIQVDNHAPVAVDNTYTVTHGGTLTVVAASGLLVNDYDSDGDALTVTNSTTPQHGSLSWSANGAFTYSPHSNYVGDDEFTYTISDGVVSRTARVQLLVQNSKPWAADDVYTLAHSTTLTVSAATGVRANDWDWDNDALTLSIVALPAHGTLVMQTSGAFTFQPQAGYVGSDSFAYRLNDGLEDSRVATVHLTINNQAPETRAAAYRTRYGQALSIDSAAGLRQWVTDSELDTLTFNLSGSASVGTVAVDASGAFNFTPPANFVGPATFQYQVIDSAGSSRIGQATIHLENRAAIGGADAYYVAAGGSLSVGAGSGVLANDEQEIGETLAATIATSPTQGTVSLQSDGSFTYVPGASYIGTDSFTYVVSDGVSNSSPITVSLTVGNGTDQPMPDAYVVRAGHTLSVALGGGVMANDYASGGTVALVAAPANGQTTLSSNGQLTYIPNSGFSGQDNLTYGLYVGGSLVGTVNVALSVLNDAPVASGDAYRTLHDTALSIPVSQGVLANDSDANNDALTVTLESGPLHGQVTLTGNGSFTYIPDAGYTGSDSFIYRVADNSLSSLATVALDVWNTVPVANGDAYSTPWNQPLTVISSQGVLANDTVDVGETVTAVVHDSPLHGTLTLNANGSFLYTPQSNYIGADSFTYKIFDGVAYSAPVTVTLDIWNQAPRGTPNIYHAHHDTTLAIGSALGVLANDVDSPQDTLTAVLLTLPGHAQSFTLLANGSFTYVPVSGFSGSDSFTYQATDGALTSVPITVTIHVENLVPTSKGDTYQVHAEKTLTVPVALGVLANDFDNDNDALIATVSQNVSHGTLTLSGNGSFTYVPNADYVGTDSFSYIVNDGASTSSPMQVTIQVENRLPVISASSYRVHHRGTLEISPAHGFIKDDYDPDGDTLSIAQLEQPQHGQLTSNEDGSFTYVPEVGFVGSDSFRYKLSDGIQTTQWATVMLDVWNSIPLAEGNYFSVQRSGEPLAGNFRNNDTEWDADREHIEVVIESEPEHGTFDHENDGSFTYTPDADFAGRDRFTYKLFDGAEYSATVTVDIEVLNNAPHGVPDTIVKHHREVYPATEGQTQDPPTVTGNVRTNDWDADGDTLTVHPYGTLPEGLTLNQDGTFSYELPDNGGDHWTGSLSFTYQLYDGASYSEPVRATIQIVNTAPIGLPDAYRMRHDSTLTIDAAAGLLANDFDADDLDESHLTVEFVNYPGSDQGTWTANEEDGSFTFTPKVNFSGEIVFQYQVFDGAHRSGPITVSISVYNQAPVAVLDQYYDSFLYVYATAQNGVLSNDFDPDDKEAAPVGGGNAPKETLKAILVEPPKFGLLVSLDFLAQVVSFSSQGLLATLVPSFGPAELSEDGGFLYIATHMLNGAALLQGADFGFDSFSYKVTDGINDSPTTTVVVSWQDPPQIGVPDEYEMLQGTGALSIPAAGVLENDKNRTERPLKAYLHTQPEHGTVTVNEDGSFTYAPSSPEFFGEDTFFYKLRETGGSADAVAVTINVKRMKPTNDEFDLVHDRRLTGNVLDNDVYSVSRPRVVLESNVDQGTLELLHNGEFFYTPPLDFKGETSFQYKLVNGAFTSDVSTVTIEVTNATPSANDDSYTTSRRRPVVKTVTDGLLSNDSDTDGDWLKVVSSTSPPASKGTLTVNEDGSFTFIPSETADGVVTFTYDVSDGIETLTRAVQIQVDDDDPTSSSVKSYSTYHDQALVVSRGDGLLNEATDEFVHELEVTQVSQPANGSLTSTADGSFTYQPSAGYVGSDSFTYRIKDKVGNLSPAYTVNLSVHNVMDEPWASIPSWVTRQYVGYQTISGDVLKPDYDIDGDLRTVSLVGSVPGLTLNPNGTFTYSGSSTSFTFTMTDGIATNSYSVSLTMLSEPAEGQSQTLTYGQSIGNAYGSVTNSGSGEIVASISANGNISLSPGNGTDFSVGAGLTGRDQGTITWSGNVTGSLSLYTQGHLNFSGNVGQSLNINMVGGDVLTGIDIDGDLSLESYGSVLGDIEARNVHAKADSFKKVTTTENITRLSALTSTRWQGTSGLGKIGDVSAGQDLLELVAGAAGTIHTNRDADQIHLYQLTQAVTIGRDLEYLTVKTDASATIGVTRDVTEVNGCCGIVAIDIGGAVTANITIGGALPQLTIGHNLTSVAQAGGNIGSVKIGRELSGSVISTGGTLGAINIGENVTAAATVSAQSISNAAIGLDLLGAITATSATGSGIGTLTVTRDLAGTATSGHGIGTATIGRTLSGTVKATAANIGSLTANSASSSAVIEATAGTLTNVEAYQDLDGVVKAGEDIVTLTAGAHLLANVTATRDITTIRAGRNGQGAVKATTGSIQSLHVGENLSGNVTAGIDIIDVLVGYVLSGNMTAYRDVVTVRVARDISGNITATTRDVNTVLAAEDLTGNITAGRHVVATVAAGGTLSGDVIAAGNIARVEAGMRWNGTDTTLVRSGGSISQSTIRAGESISVVNAAYYRTEGGEVEGTIIATAGHVQSVQADATINATITAQTYVGMVAQNMHGKGSVKGSIKALTEHVNQVLARFGDVDAAVTAKTDVNEVRATNDITGDITAVTGDIGRPYVGSDGVHTIAGKITGKIKAGHNIRFISAGKHIEGQVSAGNDVEEVIAGTNNGGNISGNVTAGNTLTTIIALGPWSLEEKRDVHHYSGTGTEVINFTPDTAQFESVREARPAAPDMPLSGAYGNITSQIRAVNIGEITAFGNIEKDLRVSGTLGPVWALGAIQGGITIGQGSANVQAWRDVSSIKTQDYDSQLNLKAYGKVKGNLDGAGRIDVIAWDDIQGNVTGRERVKVWGYGDITGDVTSKEGVVVLNALQDFTGNVSAAKDVVLNASKVRAEKIESKKQSTFSAARDSLFTLSNFALTGKIWMVSMGDLEGTEVNAYADMHNQAFTMGPATSQFVAMGDIRLQRLIVSDGIITAGRAVNVNVESWGTLKVEGTDVTLDVKPRDWTVWQSAPEWMRNLWGDGYADSIEVQATGDLKVTLDIGGHADLYATGEVTGSIDAGAHAKRSATELPKMLTDQGSSWVAIMAHQGINMESVDALGAISLETWQKVKGNYYAGAALQAMGDQGVEGTLTAEGYLRAQAWADFTATTTSKQGYVNLFAKGNFSGTVNAFGDAQVETWKDFKGNLNAGFGNTNGDKVTAAVTAHGDITSAAVIKSSHDVAITAFRDIKSQSITAGHDARVEAFGTYSSAKIIANQNIQALSWGSIDSLTLDARDGEASVWSHDDIAQLTVTANTDIDVGTAGNVKATLTSKQGNIALSALKAVQQETNITAKAGTVSIVAAETVSAKVEAGAPSSTLLGYDRAIDVIAVGSIDGSYTAKGSMSLLSLDEVKVTKAESTLGSISVHGKKVSGTYLAKQDIHATSGGAEQEGTSEAPGTALSGDYTTQQGNIRALTLGKLDAKIDAQSGSVVVYAGGEASGSVKAGATVHGTAGTAWAATVNASGQVDVAALDGDISATITSTQGGVNALASQNITGEIRGYGAVIVFARGDISAPVTSDHGKVDLFSLGELSAAVSAYDTAEVFVKGAISNAIESTNANVDVVAHGNITGNVAAKTDASVATLVTVSGSVTATEGNAKVSAITDITGAIKAGGHADVVAGGMLSGKVEADGNVTALVMGNASGEIKSGNDANVTAFGQLTSTITAGQDANVWTKGGFSGGSLTANRHARLTAYGPVSAAINSTTGNATVNAFAGLTGATTAQINANVLVVGDLLANVTATEGSATVTVKGNINSTIQAGENADVSTFGNLKGQVNTSHGNVNIHVYDGTIENFNAKAGNHLTLWSTGTASGDLKAGVDPANGSGNLDVIALGNANLTLQADESIRANVLGNYQGSAKAPGGVSVFVTGDLKGTFEAGGRVELGALQSLNSVTVIQAAHADIFSLGPMQSVNVTAGDIFAWSRTGLTASTFTSPTGNVMVLSNGAATGLTLSAAGEVRAASLSNALNVNVQNSGHAWLFGFGITGTLNSNGNAQVSSVGDTLLSVDVDGTLQAAATGVLNVSGTAGNVVLASYGTIDSNITSTNELSAWSLGSISGFLSAMYIGTVRTWSDLSAVVSATQGVREIHVWGDLTGTVTAGTAINEVYVGGNLSGGALIAPVLGWVIVGDRSPFVDLPGAPTPALAELLASTAEAYAALQNWYDDLQQAKVEIMAAATAAQAGIVRELATAMAALQDVESQAKARLEHIKNTAAVAAAEAEKQFDQALEKARNDAYAAKLDIQQVSQDAQQAANRAIKALEAEAEGYENAARDEIQFLIKQAQLASEYQNERRAAASEVLVSLIEVQEKTFAGVFLKKLATYAADFTQEVLDIIGTIGDFFGPWGSLVGAGADLINAGISFARGDGTSGLIYVFSAIPWVGLAGKAIKPFGKAGTEAIVEAGAKSILKTSAENGAEVGIRGVSKFVRSLPDMLINTARQITCVVTGTGCFVAGTVVLVNPESAIPAGKESDHSAHWAFPAILVGVGVIGHEVIRRRRKQEEEHDAVLANWDHESSPDCGTDGDNEELLMSRPQVDCGSASENYFAAEGAKWQTGGSVTAVLNDVAASVLVRSVPPASTPHLGTTMPIASRHRNRPTSTFHARLCLIACLLLAGFFALPLLRSSFQEPDFISDKTPIASRPIGQRIETIRVGQAVLSHNPTKEKDAEFGLEIDADKWKILTLRAAKADGSYCDMELLRPDWWIEAVSAKETGVAYVSVPECGIDGNASVIAINPCPPINSPPDGYSIVTGTFRHSSADVIDLHLDGVKSPIGVTRNHPIWSVEREAFCEAALLQTGEHVQGLHGPIRISKVGSSGRSADVYNLEVHVSHAYSVGSEGVIVHNIKNPLCREALDVARAFGDCDTAARYLRDRMGGLVRAVPTTGHKFLSKGKHIYDPIFKSQNDVHKYLTDVEIEKLGLRQAVEEGFFTKAEYAKLWGYIWSKRFPNSPIPPDELIP